MAGLLSVDPAHHGMYEATHYNYNQDKPEDGGGRWYFSRKEIEETSPSKRDGIDSKKESYLRKSYCTFLQDLGMRLKVPQVTIATAMIFCHRFFLRQSHGKNDRRTIATVCMFLAGKVEETPRPLKDVILVSFEIINKKDPAAVQRIKQKEVYEQQKELILLGERVVLATLGFDFNVHHPYKPLVEAIKKFKVAQNALAQVAWNFVNDGLRTSLCLQFKPHHIAAGAIFLAAKFLKVKLPSDGEKVWWQEFDVTPRQLEEVSNQMLELYEQNRLQASGNSEVEGSTGGGVAHRVPSKTPTRNDEPGTSNSYSHAGGSIARSGITKPGSSMPMSEQQSVDNDGGPPRATQSQGNDHLSTEMRSVSDHRADGESKVNEHHEREQLPHQPYMGEANYISRFRPEGANEKEPENNLGRNERVEAVDYKEKHMTRNLDQRESNIGQSPQEAIKKIDRDKVKAALEKRKKSRGDVSRKIELMNEEDLIEKELEDGIELPSESEKHKRIKKQSLPKSSNRVEHDNSRQGKHQEDIGDGNHRGNKRQSSHDPDLDNVEEGELSMHDDDGHGFRSPKSSNRKRKAGSPIDNHHSHRDYNEDQNRVDRHHKRHTTENHA